MDKDTINIQVIYETEEENKKFVDCSGWCDQSVRTIHIKNRNDNNYELNKNLQSKTLRHEIIHAFLYESGLWRNSFTRIDAWSMNEEMVDWIAIQFPKIAKVYEQLGILK